ncbi:signal peptidase II [Candidatus Woesearchaeota archaeon]|nr:signal peptidase II [Candidatus Woesearchaeota archaeon]
MVKKKGAWFKNNLLYIIIFVAVLVVDQVTKYLTYTYLEEKVALIPGVLWLSHIINTGASFGSLQGQNALLIWVALIVLGVLIYSYDTFRTKTEKIFYTLILSGLIGNLIDRVLFGGVTDMIDLGWWPVFNIADSALVVGVLGMIVYEIWKKIKH